MKRKINLLQHPILKLLSNSPRKELRYNEILKHVQQIYPDLPKSSLHKLLKKMENEQLIVQKPYSPYQITEVGEKQLEVFNLREKRMEEARKCIVITPRTEAFGYYCAIDMRLRGVLPASTILDRLGWRKYCHKISNIENLSAKLAEIEAKDKEDFLRWMLYEDSERSIIFYLAPPTSITTEFSKSGDSIVVTMGLFGSPEFESLKSINDKEPEALLVYLFTDLISHIGRLHGAALSLNSSLDINGIGFARLGDNYYYMKEVNSEWYAWVRELVNIKYLRGFEKHYLPTSTD